LDNLVPIILFVYNRLEHTQKTVESLLKNPLAEYSKLFIYSDGAKNEKDLIKVKAVRNYIRDINGFFSTEIVERPSNLGLANSVISGVSEIIKFSGKVIVMEDDIVSAPKFLKYMNEALNIFENDERIYSISGYTFPIKIPQNYDLPVYLSYRSSSWGWGTWKNRWENVDWKIKDYESFKLDRKAQIIFNKGGEDLTPMLNAQMKGMIDSWAIRWTYAHFKNNAYCVMPVKSYCKNIGTDSSGTHSATTKKFDGDLQESMEAITDTDTLEIDEKIISNIRKFVQPSIFRKMINNIKRI
jgi:GNT-I family